MPKSLSVQRLAAFNRQAGRCYYCKAVMWLDQPHKFAAKHSISLKEASRFQCTGEHLIARQDGGKNSHENIVAACRFCNQRRHKRKSALSANAFKVHVSRRTTRHKWHPRKLHHVINL